MDEVTVFLTQRDTVLIDSRLKKRDSKTFSATRKELTRALTANWTYR
jgi:hypothetical protein